VQGRVKCVIKDSTTVLHDACMAAIVITL